MEMCISDISVAVGGHNDSAAYMGNIFCLYNRYLKFFSDYY